MEVSLYTKEGCCLCEEAKRVILEVQSFFPFTFREIDITSDPSLHEEFKEQIPVVFINGKKALKLRVTTGDLLELLKMEEEGGLPD
jgi:glutaredoxin